MKFNVNFVKSIIFTYLVRNGLFLNTYTYIYHLHLLIIHIGGQTNFNNVLLRESRNIRCLLHITFDADLIVGKKKN